MEKVLEDIVDELLSETDLSGYSSEELMDLKIKILDNFYEEIILRAIEQIDYNNKEIFLNNLRKSEGDVDSVMEVIGKYITEPEKLIGETITVFKKDIKKYL